MTTTVTLPPIAVALSGGVDSAVAAALLKQQGYPVFGITMAVLPDSAETSAAEKVAAHLGIPFHIVDFTARFEQQIIIPFINSYLNGETPNPCLRCNQLIKFGLLLEQARLMGAELMATGHYARVRLDDSGQAHLYTGRDCLKDQSYFMATIGQEALKRIRFPLGDLTGKVQVRQLAEDFGLPVADSKDSQDVCFLPQNGYGPFFKSRNVCPEARGLLVHRNGKLLGRHNGFWQYTVGQRRGLGLSWTEPLYVIEVNAARNRVVVGEEKYLYATGLLAENAVWFGKPPLEPFEAHCKIRYRHHPVACRVEPLEDASLRVIFKEPQRAVTPGQAIVIYIDDEVLGAGWITGPDQSC